MVALHAVVSEPEGVAACQGQRLSSGLEADPCSFCKRRSFDVLVGRFLEPAVVWVETSSRVGYECVNQVRKG